MNWSPLQFQRATGAVETAGPMEIGGIARLRRLLLDDFHRPLEHLRRPHSSHSPDDESIILSQLEITKHNFYVTPRSQRFEHPEQQVVFQEYVDTVMEARRRVAGLEGQMREVLEQWSLRPMVEALIALRGVDVVTAMTVLAELGDLTRFDSPRELMSFLGLVPSEHSSGPRRRQGAITKTGNGHVRRVLVESAWSYRFPARKTRHLRCKASAAPPAVQAIAWAAQKRLCTRYRHLYSAGKAKCVVTTAVARELVGFIWAIACEVMGRAHATRARS